MKNISAKQIYPALILKPPFLMELPTIRLNLTKYTKTNFKLSDYINYPIHNLLGLTIRTHNAKEQIMKKPLINKTFNKIDIYKEKYAGY